jgi:hypothetical protein
MTGPKRQAAGDAMLCRVCGREERASEGYPCADCGTFICLICNFRGKVRCRACVGGAAPTGERTTGPEPDEPADGQPEGGA